MSCRCHRATCEPRQRRRLARAPGPHSGHDVPAGRRRHRLPRAHPSRARRGRRQGPFVQAALDLRAQGLAGGLGHLLAAAAAAGRPRPDRHDQDPGAAARRRPVSLHGQPALLQGAAGTAARGRQRREVHDEPARDPPSSPPSGATCGVDIAGKPHRIYVEQAGEGIPLVCLHTAGADGRQYRGLLNDAETLARFRVIAFDLPWHGKSSPPAGWQSGEYKLTSRTYVDTIMAVIDALGLDKPVVMGCSIGGRIVLHLALEHARALPRPHRPGVRRPRRALLRPRLAAPPGRARRGDVRRHDLRPDRPDRARGRPLGDDLALHAGRPRRLQRRPALLHGRRRRARPRGRDRHGRLPALPADRRIRLLRHAADHARARRPHQGRARPPSWPASATSP